MLTKDEIYTIYEQYKIDLKPNVMPAKIEVIGEQSENIIARVGKI